MGFGLSYEGGGGGGIVPVVKYDARAGRLFRVDRVDGVNNPADITRQFKAVVDLSNVEVGWINFATGGAPNFALVKLGQPLPPKPSNDHKQGIRVMLKLGRECGGDVRELSTVAKVAMRGLDELHTAYEAAREAQAGQLPVVVLKDTVSLTSGTGDKKSTNYQPVFEIVGWSARPTDLVWGAKDGASTPAPDARPASSTPPTTGSQQVGAPTAAPGDDEDFG